MKDLAIELLTRAGMSLDAEDIAILAEDLTDVEYDPRVDSPYIRQTAENIFLHRLGGIGNLNSYMKCIRIR